MVIYTFDHIWFVVGDGVRMIGSHHNEKDCGPFLRKQYIGVKLSEFVVQFVFLDRILFFGDGGVDIESYGVLFLWLWVGGVFVVESGDTSLIVFLCFGLPNVSMVHCAQVRVRIAVFDGEWSRNAFGIFLTYSLVIMAFVDGFVAYF